MSINIYLNDSFKNEKRYCYWLSISLIFGNSEMNK